ncbi:glycine cleavage system aminomethyltransferase GcvT [Microbacterium sp. cf332]|uniref:glycine cleavage system aminomethyltransferase GcvT n=1 Tax=Microbacterium sp. cf332 TaxID=1761804 RepID=UPI000881A199|nr:glycine cleavage system aminomethyltransferase GcvT [Microbacterium sp. cf332]SDQ06386.1 aminomethyltransferase [Microbacterium sp. cf332]
MSDPRSTVLHHRHTALGASFTDFGGWLMPVRYTSDLAEHHAVRSAAGLFDISHMAEFEVTGSVAGDYLDAALAGVLSAMPVGKAKYSLVLAVDGGIIDDVIVYRLADERFLVIANAGNRAPVWAALQQRAEGWDVELRDLTDEYALLAVQGPAALSVLEATPGLTTTGVALADTRYYAWASAEFAGEPLLLARTGYTGEDGFELMVPIAAAEALWDALLAAGAPFGLVPAGLASRDTLRLEAGMPLYGHELSLQVTPTQAGLGRAVAMDKPEFVGRKGLGSRDGSDVPVLVGLASAGRRAGRAGYAVLGPDGERVGEVTSGALSPTLGHPIAMAYVAPVFATPGTELALDVRGTRIPATVTPLPFYRRKK